MQALLAALTQQEAMEMGGYAIVRLVADEIAEKDGILRQFNAYMHMAVHGLAFVHDSEGYFRLPCHEGTCGFSSGIMEFGKFLQSTGYTMVGAQIKAALDGENSTEVSFAKGGREAHVTLSTLFVR